MRKILLFLLVFELSMIGWCFANEYEAELTVGEHSIDGGLQYKKRTMDGYWKAKGSALYADKDNIDYKWLNLDFAVGSETLLPGMGVEVGFKGLFGEVEQPLESGDVGAMAFAGRVSYTFFREITFIPIEIYGELAYAPEVLSFRDTKNVFTSTFGLAFYIVDTAAIVVNYNDYNIDFTSGSRDWKLNENEFRFGLKLRF